MSEDGGTRVGFALETSEGRPCKVCAIHPGRPCAVRDPGTKPDAALATPPLQQAPPSLIPVGRVRHVENSVRYFAALVLQMPQVNLGLLG